MQMAVKSQSCPGLLSSCRRLPLVSSRIACWGEGRNLEELSISIVSWARTENNVGNPHKYQKNELTYSSAPSLPTGSHTSAADMDLLQLGGNADAWGSIVEAKHTPAPAP